MGISNARSETLWTEAGTMIFDVSSIGGQQNANDPDLGTYRHPKGIRPNLEAFPRIKETHL